jgi:putative sterol carrier protein
MSFKAILEDFKAQATNVAPLNGKLKMVIDENPIMIDGTGSENTVSADDGEADCVIITDSGSLAQLRSGELNPMMAVMSGKVKIKGDMGMAMKLQSLVQ